METKAKYTLKPTRVFREVDICPDLSHLGTYTDNIGPGVIIREHGEFYERISTEMERDECGRFIGRKAPEYQKRWREYLGVIPGNNIPHNMSNWRHVSKACRAEVIAKHGSLRNADYHYALEDYKRLEAYNRGDWSMYIIVVETGTTNDTGIPSGEISNCIGGIESDSKDSYLSEVISDLLSEQKRDLLSAGFSEEEITESFKTADAGHIEDR